MAAAPSPPFIEYVYVFCPSIVFYCLQGSLGTLHSYFGNSDLTPFALFTPGNLTSPIVHRQEQGELEKLIVE